MTAGRVVVVGLGPAGLDHLLPTARSSLEAIAVRYVRTARHPAVAELAREGLELAPLDHHYERADSLDDVYAGIVNELLEAAERHGEVAYAVPGNPVVAERSVSLLAASGVELRLVSGLSFAELAWTRLGVDPVGGGRLVDGRTLERWEVLLGGRLLIGQVDQPRVLSHVKLMLLEALDADTEVTLIRRLGLPDESVASVPLDELDRGAAPDHLTSVFVDLDASSGEELARLQALVERLRGPGGCPWDAEQTHHTLTRHLIEEAYEVVEAIEELPADAPGGRPAPSEEAYALLEEELGDLAAQVVFHATLAREGGAFTLTEVFRGIREKLVRRHPHVFGDVEAESAEAVTRNWERIKRQEKGEPEAGPSSLVDVVPEHLPALLYAHKLLRQADSGGLDLMSVPEAVRGAREALGRSEDAAPGDAERLVGDALAAVVLLARAKGFDAESALRGWTRRFRERFRSFERLASERGLELETLEPDEVSALWLEAAPTGTNPDR